MALLRMDRTDDGSVELTPLTVEEDAGEQGPVFRVRRSSATGSAVDEERCSELVTRTAIAAFRMGEGWVKGGASRRGKPTVTAFLSRRRGDEQRPPVLHTLYRQIVIRFRPGTSRHEQDAVLGEFQRWRPTSYAPNALEFRVFHPSPDWSGQKLIDASNAFMEHEGVEFAVPNFVSECRRSTPPSTEIDKRQWHLTNGAGGLSVQAAWKQAPLRGRGIVVAVLDDGVERSHPGLRGRVLPLGRDYFVKSDKPEHFDADPKRRRDKDWINSDYHGTPCAGLIAANGFKNVWGVAPECFILPVRIFAGTDQAEGNRLARAIRYAARIADVISCSWDTTYRPDISAAIAETEAGREGKGAVLVAAAGNDRANSLDYPASSTRAVAVGSCTRQGEQTVYSNAGERLSIVAPSGEQPTIDVKDGLYTTDLMDTENKAGIAEGAFTLLGATSAATAVAAGVAALVLSANPDLTAEEVRAILRDTADEIGGVAYQNGHHRAFGCGRINPARAVAEAKQRLGK